MIVRLPFLTYVSRQHFYIFDQVLVIFATVQVPYVPYVHMTLGCIADRIFLYCSFTSLMSGNMTSSAYFLYAFDIDFICHNTGHLYLTYKIVSYIHVRHILPYSLVEVFIQAPSCLSLDNAKTNLSYVYMAIDPIYLPDMYMVHMYEGE